MAIDTQTKRVAVANLGKPSPVFLPFGSIDSDARSVFLRLYPVDVEGPNDFAIFVCIGPAVPIAVQNDVPSTMRVSLDAAVPFNVEIAPV